MRWKLDAKSLLCLDITGARRSDLQNGRDTLLILYGSQTGNSREVSKELCEKAVAKGTRRVVSIPTSRRSTLRRSGGSSSSARARGTRRAGQRGPFLPVREAGRRRPPFSPSPLRCPRATKTTSLLRGGQAVRPALRARRHALPQAVRRRRGRGHRGDCPQVVRSAVARARGRARRRQRRRRDGRGRGAAARRRARPRRRRPSPRRLRRPTTTRRRWSCAAKPVLVPIVAARWLTASAAGGDAAADAAVGTDGPAAVRAAGVRRVLASSST